jgi:hypothetical protein
VIETLFRGEAVYIRDELLEISLIPGTDPVLLTSIIEFVNDILNNAEDEVAD